MDVKQFSLAAGELVFKVRLQSDFAGQFVEFLAPAYAAFAKRMRFDRFAIAIAPNLPGNRLDVLVAVRIIIQAGRTCRTGAENQCAIANQFADALGDSRRHHVAIRQEKQAVAHAAGRDKSSVSY